MLRTKTTLHGLGEGEGEGEDENDEGIKRGSVPFDIPYESATSLGETTGIIFKKKNEGQRAGVIIVIRKLYVKTIMIIIILCLRASGDLFFF